MTLSFDGYWLSGRKQVLDHRLSFPIFWHLEHIYNATIVLLLNLTWPSLRFFSLPQTVHFLSVCLLICGVDNATYDGVIKSLGIQLYSDNCLDLSDILFNRIYSSSVKLIWKNVESSQPLSSISYRFFMFNSFQVKIDSTFYIYNDCKSYAKHFMQSMFETPWHDTFSCHIIFCILCESATCFILLALLTQDVWYSMSSDLCKSLQTL